MKQAPKPQRMEVDLAGIPPEIKEKDNWLLWPGSGSHADNSEGSAQRTVLVRVRAGLWAAILMNLC